LGLLVGRCIKDLNRIVRFVWTGLPLRHRQIAMTESNLYRFRVKPGMTGV
jgi:hypothetical protein